MFKGTGIFFAGALAVALSSSAWAQTSPPAGSPVARHGALKVVGNKIVGQHGNPVALRGMSFFWNDPGWNQAQYYTAGAVNTLADDWKVDIVRVAVAPDKTSETNWSDVVNAAKAKGIYVIIDFHAHNKSLQSSAVSFFEGLAGNAAYKNVPNVLYEIFNEPCATSVNQNGGGGCGGDSWATDIKPYATAVVNAIRAKGDTNVVIIGTPGLSKWVNQAAASPVSGKNLAYALHFYTGHVSGYGDPTESEHRIRLRNAATEALGKGAAIFVSEFGISQPGGGLVTGETNIIDTVEARKWFDFLDANSIGWANWSISNKPEAASALVSSNGGGGWTAGSTNCNAFNGTTNITACSNHGDLRCSGSFIRTKLRYYATPVTLTTTSTEGGSVSASPPAPYYPWQQVTVTGTAQSGYRFEGWSSGVTGNLAESPKSVTLTGNTSVAAVFFPVNPISNSTFTAGTAGWDKYPGSGATMPEANVVNGELVITMPASVGAEPYEVRVQHGNTALTNGKRYELTFEARATQARTIQAAYRTSSNMTGGHKINIGEPVSLTTTKTAYSREFDMSDATTTTGVIAFYLGGKSGNVTIDNVLLKEKGASSVIPQTASARKASWSVSRGSGALQLRGPAETGARVSLYDLRGKAVRSLAVADGLTLGAGIPAGSYFVVVRDRAGGEVLRTRVVLAR